MRHHVTSGVALGALLVALAACGDRDSPVQPSVEPPSPARPDSSGAGGSFPQVPGSALVYDRVSPSFIPGSSSRYVLYDDGTFRLQYVTPRFGFFEYPGKYSRADSVLTFKFDGWSVLGPWLADGIARGHSLIVKYNDIMLSNDFEDGEYVRSPSAP
jgi:hypothetical protein